MTISARTIVQEAAKALGAYFEAVLTVATVNPHTTLTVPKVLDVTFDPERFQYWYVIRQNPAALQISSITSATGLVVCLLAHNLAPGDTVTITGTGNANYDGKEFTVFTTPTANNFTITSGLGSVVAGSVNITNQFRVVSSSGVPSAGTVTLTRAFQGDPTFAALPVGTPFDMYLILTPDEWLDAAGTAISDSFYKDKAEITLVAGQTEYNVTSVASWLMTEGQVLRARYRDATVAAAPVEADVPAIYFDEDDFALTARLPTLPSNVANVTLRIDARHYYPKFTTWSDTTTLPEALAVQKTVDVALKKIFQKLGPAAKRVYGMAMVVAERDLAESEGRWLDNTAKRAYSSEEYPLGGADDYVMSWGW